MSIDEDESATAFDLRVDFYPLKELGIGVSYGSIGHEDDFDGFDSSTVGVRVSYALDKYVPGLDLNLEYSSTGYDDMDEWEGNTIAFTADYRF